MPKLGVEPIRKDALIKATIAEIGRTGSLDVTVSQISKRAGMSSALAHHYFGSKEEMLLAAMRHILTLYGREVRLELAKADSPRDRLHAIFQASFSPANFQTEMVSAWLNFWVMAQSVPQARRLLQIYHTRLRSNLLFCLRPLAGAGAADLADGLGVMIDGLYLRAALGAGAEVGAHAVATAEGYLDARLQVAGS